MREGRHHIIIHVPIDGSDILSAVMLGFHNSDTDLVERIQSRVETHNAKLGQVNYTRQTIGVTNNQGISLHDGTGHTGIQIDTSLGQLFVTQIAINAANLINSMVKADRIDRRAAIQHEETRSMKADALAFYDTHRPEFKSRKACAEHIAKHIVPAKVRTINEKWLKGRK